MKYHFFYIATFIWLLISCSGNVSPIPFHTHCENIEQIGIDSLTAHSAQITWKNLTHTLSYDISLTNTANNQDTLLSVIDSFGISANTFSQAVTGLLSGTLYEVKIRPICGKLSLPKYGDWSPSAFFVTDNLGNCAQPVNFAVFEAKQDTLTLAWQNLPNMANYVISITDSMGNLVVHQAYTDVSPITSPMRYGLFVSNLPDGDYTIWIQSDCGSELSLPSNIGVFTLRHSGGGPVVVIDDNIDIYAPSNCPSCAVNFPVNSPNSDVISPRSMTFANRNTPPQQVLIGYNVANNANLSCAPIGANTWRIKSLRVHAPYFNMPTNDYRVSLPALKCVCAGEEYAVRVIARDMFMPFSGGVVGGCP